MPKFVKEMQEGFLPVAPDELQASLDAWSFIRDRRRWD